MSELENHFKPFRDQIIGNDLKHTLLGKKQHVLYADWTASGRLYAPIEEYISSTLGPYVANTHTETSLTGTSMTQCYAEAQSIIKEHVNASKDDVLILDGSGMTGVVNKFQRILGLRIPEHLKGCHDQKINDKPVVFVTHMEHHSNQTTWLACAVTVEVINAGDNGLPSLEHLENLLEQYKDRELKIGAFSATSNVTGIITNYFEMAEIMHQHNGLCFVDFAASAPYIEIDMHPKNPLQKLDAVFFSPHKFLGGPGSSGVLIFDKSLYKNKIPDNPGGGTVAWTNPWGEHVFLDNIETREDGGTPGFLQCIRTALAIKVKMAMGIEKIAEREKQLVKILMDGFEKNPNLMMLEPEVRERICIVSFYMKSIHFNLMVKLLNDYFGIQTRGGCSCAGTYGHILLGVSKEKSHEITDMINDGDLSQKPGWIRVSMHPTSTDKEAHYIVDAINQITDNFDDWSKNYDFDAHSGEFVRQDEQQTLPNLAGFSAV